MNIYHGVDSFHSSHQFLHKLHANVKHKSDNCTEQAKGHQINLNIGLNEILGVGTLLSYGMLTTLVF